MTSQAQAVTVSLRDLKEGIISSSSTYTTVEAKANGLHNVS